MVDVQTEIEIDKSIQFVREYTSNPDNAPTWYVNIQSAERKSPEPIKLGSLIDFKAKFLGKELSYTYEIVRMNDSEFVMQTAQGPFPMRTTYSWESTGENSTKIQLRNTGEPSGFSKLMAPLMATMMKRANNKDLRKLKEILEAK